jgi:hypothetical protein
MFLYCFSVSPKSENILTVYSFNGVGGGSMLDNYFLMGFTDFKAVFYSWNDISLSFKKLNLLQANKYSFSFSINNVLFIYNNIDIFISSLLEQCWWQNWV